MSEADALLDFWFDPRGAPDYATRRKVWFRREKTFDDAVAARFRDLSRRAREGGLDHWRDEPRSCLALVILLDQVPRNLFRDSTRAFASDAQALGVARHAIDAGYESALSRLERLFLYLPYEHSEDGADQDLALRLFASLGEDEEARQILGHAEEHHAVIARFGRFPHRNAALGRASTPEEEAFLEGPGSSFGGYGAGE